MIYLLRAKQHASTRKTLEQKMKYVSFSNEHFGNMNHFYCSIFKLTIFVKHNHIVVVYHECSFILCIFNVNITSILEYK